MLRKVITYIRYPVLIAGLMLCLVAVALRPGSGQAQAATGNLSGYAWGTNVGWINFNPSDSQVTIDPATGSFDGYAWAENVGWIHFKGTAPAYNAVTDFRPPPLVPVGGVHRAGEQVGAPSAVGGAGGADGGGCRGGGGLEAQKRLRSIDLTGFENPLGLPRQKVLAHDSPEPFVLRHARFITSS